MKRMARFAGLAIAARALLAAAAGSNDDPAYYAVRIPIVGVAGTRVQRLPIPAQALASSAAADLSDLRVFDAAGKAMPMARIDPVAAGRRDVLPALPILGAADALNVTGVSLRLDGSGYARVAQVSGTVARGRARSVVLGMLLDARGIVGAARSLTLDADLPVAQPVKFTIDASVDLQNWRPIAEKVIYRPAASASGDRRAAISLAGAALDGDYLRVTWHAESLLLTPVVVRRALLVTASTAAPTAPYIDAVTPSPLNAHALEFALPFSAAIASIRVVPAADADIVPIRVFGRDDGEQQWTLLGHGMAARSAIQAAQGGIALSGTAYRTMRIEADRSSSGFVSAPAIRFRFAPSDLVFLAAGRAPYVLAAGNASATDHSLPLDSLMESGADEAVPIATTITARQVLRLQPVGGPSRLSQVLLWAILLGATGTLALMAWLLKKRNQPAT